MARHSPRVLSCATIRPAREKVHTHARLLFFPKACQFHCGELSNDELWQTCSGTLLRQVAQTLLSALRRSRPPPARAQKADRKLTPRPTLPALKNPQFQICDSPDVPLLPLAAGIPAPPLQSLKHAFALSSLFYSLCLRFSHLFFPPQLPISNPGSGIRNLRKLLKTKDGGCF